MHETTSEDADVGLPWPPAASVLGIKGTLRIRPHGSTQKAHVTLRRVDASDYFSDDEDNHSSFVYFSLFAQKRIEVKPGKEILLTVSSLDGRFNDSPVIFEGDALGSESEDDDDEDEEPMEVEDLVPPKMRRAMNNDIPQKLEVEDAIVRRDIGVQSDVQFASAEVQVQPDVQTIGTQARPEVCTVGMQAQPEVNTVGTQARPHVSTIGTQARPDVSAIGTQVQPDVSTFAAQAQPSVSTAGTQVQPDVRNYGTQARPEVNTFGAQAQPDTSIASIQVQPSVSTVASQIQPEVVEVAIEARPDLTSMSTQVELPATHDKAASTDQVEAPVIVHSDVSIQVSPIEPDSQAPKKRTKRAAKAKPQPEQPSNTDPSQPSTPSNTNLPIQLQSESLASHPASQSHPNINGHIPPLDQKNTPAKEGASSILPPKPPPSPAIPHTPSHLPAHPHTHAATSLPHAPGFPATPHRSHPSPRLPARTPALPPSQPKAMTEALQRQSMLLGNSKPPPSGPRSLRLPAQQQKNTPASTSASSLPSHTPGPPVFSTLVPSSSWAASADPSSYWSSYPEPAATPSSLAPEPMASSDPSFFNSLSPIPNANSPMTLAQTPTLKRKRQNVGDVTPSTRQHKGINETAAPTAASAPVLEPAPQPSFAPPPLPAPLEPIVGKFKPLPCTNILTKKSDTTPAQTNTRQPTSDVLAKAKPKANSQNSYQRPTSGKTMLSTPKAPTLPITPSPSPQVPVSTPSVETKSAQPPPASSSTSKAKPPQPKTTTSTKPAPPAPAISTLPIPITGLKHPLPPKPPTVAQILPSASIQVAPMKIKRERSRSPTSLDKEEPPRQRRRRDSPPIVIDVDADSPIAGSRRRSRSTSRTRVRTRIGHRSGSNDGRHWSPGRSRSRSPLSPLRSRHRDRSYDSRSRSRSSSRAPGLSLLDRVYRPSLLDRVGGRGQHWSPGRSYSRSRSRSYSRSRSRNRERSRTRSRRSRSRSRSMSLSHSRSRSRLRSRSKTDDRDREYERRKRDLDRELDRNARSRSRSRRKSRSRSRSRSRSKERRRKESKRERERGRSAERKKSLDRDTRSPSGSVHGPAPPPKPAAAPMIIKTEAIEPNLFELSRLVEPKPWPVHQAFHSTRVMTAKAGDNTAVYGIKVSYDGNMIAMRCSDKTLRIFNNRNHLEMSKLCNMHALLDMAWMQGDTGIVALDAEGKVYQWDRDKLNPSSWNMRQIMDIAQERKQDEAMLFAYSGDTIAVAFPSVGVKLWVCTKGNWMHSRTITRQHVTAIRFVDDGQALLGGTKDGVLWYCELPGGGIRAHAFLQSKITHLAVNQNETYALVSIATGSASIVGLPKNGGNDKGAKAILKDLSGTAIATYGFAGAFCKGGAILYGSSDGYVLVWDQSNPRAVKVVGGLDHGGDEVTAMSNYDGGRDGYVITGTSHGRVLWWSQPKV